MERVTLPNLLQEGFIFREFDGIPEEIFQAIENLPSVNANQPKGLQSSHKCQLGPENPVWHYFINLYLESVKGDSFLESLVPYMKVGIDKCVKDDWVMPHTDIAISGVAQAALFLTRDENFEGRDFVYGVEDDQKEFRPNNHTICFIETTQQKFVHACRKLRSDSVFYAVGIFPVAPGGRNELLVLRDDLTNKWKICE